MDFRKEMTGFYMHSVCLPEKVTKDFNDFVGKNLKFKCKSGDVWHVGLIRSGDKLVLQPGWSHFASSNNVSQNDLLLFKFMSGSTFEVRILNPFGHEKNSLEGRANAISIEKAVDVKVEEDNMIQSSSKYKRMTRGYDTSAEKGRSNPHLRKRSPCQNQSSLPVKKRLKFDESEGEEEAFEEARRTALLVMEHQAHLRRNMGLLKFDASAKKGRSNPRPRKRSPCQNQSSLPVKKRLKFYESEVEEEALEEARRTALLVMEHQALLRRKMGLLKNDDTSETNAEKHSSQNSIDCDVPVGYAYAPQHWRAMSAEQKTRANSLALEIQTGNPIFLHVLQQSCLTKKSWAAVPKEFSAKHLPKGNRTFVLHRPEKENTWSVRYYFRKTHQTIEGTSWLKFVQENNLREGDICMFELVNSAHQIAFHVHVAQASSSGTQ